jgi:hypothetical protein
MTNQSHESQNRMPEAPGKLYGNQLPGVDRSMLTERGSGGLGHHDYDFFDTTGHHKAVDREMSRIVISSMVED